MTEVKKRHRRTKAEMLLSKQDILTDKLVNISKANEPVKEPMKVEPKTKKYKRVKLKYNYKKIPKDTILNIVNPKKDKITNLYIYVEYNNIPMKIYKTHLFYVI